MEGRVQGCVEAKSVEFTSTAIFHADVALERIEVVNAAQFEGLVTRLDQAASSAGSLPALT